MICVTRGKSASNQSSKPSRTRTIIISASAAIRITRANIKITSNTSRAVSPPAKRPKPDAREGIVTVALMQAMEESCAKGRPVKIKDVLAQHELADLLNA